MKKKYFQVSFFLVFSIFSFGQCPFLGGTELGIYTNCIDNSNIVNSANVIAGQYIRVNVVKGFNYTFSVGDINGVDTEDLTIYDSLNTTSGNHLVFNSGATGTSITWTSSLSGQIIILFTRASCLSSGGNSGSITVRLNTIGNTQDLQTIEGIDSWKGHVYNWTGIAPPGGASPNSPTPASFPFIDSNYVGYYNQTENFIENFTGSTTCFPVLSNNITRSSIYTDRFAVRYRMKSTKIGCYLVTVFGDDGVRLYVDGVKVLDEWKLQSTGYQNVLINLTGTSELVLDYFERQTGNRVNFTLTPFNPLTNSVLTSTPTSRCSGTSSFLNGSAYVYNGATVNPTIAMQWESSTDNITFTPIVGATSEDYTVPATTPISNETIYYRRKISSVYNTASCVYYTSAIAITTNPYPNAPTLNLVSQPDCQTTGTINITNYDASYTYSVTPSTGVTLSGSNINAPAGSYTVIASNGPCNSVSSLPIVLNSNITSTWDGTSWSSGVPSLNDIAIIAGNYDTASNGNFSCCRLIINNGASLTITSNNYIEIKNDVVNNGNLFIQNNGSLIQINNSVINSGSGTNSMQRNPTNLHLYDYVYWSTPQTTTTFSTIPNSRYYQWEPDQINPLGYGQGNWITPSTLNMSVGRGYIFRVPNSLNQNTTFSGGNFNNGVINTSLVKGTYTGAPYTGTNGVITNTDDNWNLIGNPYPSAIDAIQFLTDNVSVLENAEVSLWRHLSPISSNFSSPYYQSFTYNYSGNDYVTYTATGSLPAGAFNGKIASGQGFFVRMKEDSSVISPANITFNNAQRSKTHDNSQFYKSNSVTKTYNDSYLEKHRIWLDLINPNNIATSHMIGYIEEATNADDFLYEAKSSLVSGFQFYSLINNKTFKIQGRALPFDENDTVALGIIVPSDGLYTIAINTLDGRFLNSNNKVYLEDKVLNIIHDLKASPYHFNTIKGNYTNRFVLRYNNQTLNTEENLINNDVRVYSIHNDIYIESNNYLIVNYEVFDILGRELIRVINSNQNNVRIDSVKSTNQTLLIKIKLENGQSLVKKIIH